MSNHFHLLIRDSSEEGGGVSRFMQKLGTAYTMYFNKSRERVGNLFVKPFRAKPVRDDGYLTTVARYIHFNPIELFEPGWKMGAIREPSALEDKLRSYRFSSLPDYEGEIRPESALISAETRELFDREDKLSLSESLAEMAEYYQSLS